MIWSQLSTGISKGLSRLVAEGNWSGVSVNKLGVAFAKKFKFAETPSQYSLNVVFTQRSGVRKLRT